MLLTLDEAIIHCLKVADGQTAQGACPECAMEHRQLAQWLNELRVFKSRKGQWLRMSDLSEQEDDRYKCSYCGNVIHRKSKMDVYTFNSWCGRCGSDNGRKIEVKL